MEDDIRMVFEFFATIKAALKNQKTLRECRELLNIEAKQASDAFGRIFDAELSKAAK